MIRYKTRAFALIAGLAVVPPLHAQMSPGVQTVQAVPDPNDPVERLGRYIRILAGAPRDLSALLGAGQAALDVGDPNAALGFFARAEAVSPSNGAVKAGLGSSLVMIERPDDALRLFAEAVSLGVPDAAIARDRGLAYDLRGDSKRAQRDYALAMTRGRDDELVRRYALSLGISGDRSAAIAMLDPLLRKQDQGAWRARAFILAMTGDVSGANGVARQLMVPSMAAAMSPLLARLEKLNPAERAHAVNFGTVPSDGTQLAVQTGDPYLSGITRPTGIQSTSNDYGTGLIPTGEPLGPRPEDTRPTRLAQADSLEVRRRPGVRVTTPATPGFSAPVGSERIAPVDPAKLPPEARGEISSVTVVPVRTLPPPSGAAPTAAAPPPKPQPAPTQIAQATVPPSAPALAPAATPRVVGPPADPVPTSTSAPVFEVPKPTPATPAPKTEAAPAATPPPVPADRLAGLLDGLERENDTAAELPSARELRNARAAARKKMAELAAQSAAEAAAKKEREEAAAAAKKYPARLWVQVATGRNDSGLALTWRRLRDDAPSLKSQTPWSAPFKATNRIVVGPMKSATAARELVNKLAKDGVQANVWSSEAGEEVERISAK